MPGTFTASVRENPGRQFLVVEFRHPLRTDASNRRGKKIRQGLGTPDRAEAEMLVAQLNDDVDAQEFLDDVKSKVIRSFLRFW